MKALRAAERECGAVAWRAAIDHERYRTTFASRAALSAASSGIGDERVRVGQRHRARVRQSLHRIGRKLPPASSEIVRQLLGGACPDDWRGDAGTLQQPAQRDLCRRLAYIICDGNYRIEAVLNAYGGAIVSNDGKKVVFNPPETVEAITFLADVFGNPKYAKMIPPGQESWTDTGNNEAWLNGTAGFVENAYTLYAQSYRDKNPIYGNTAMISGVLGPATDRVIVTGSMGGTGGGASPPSDGYRESRVRARLPKNVLNTKVIANTTMAKTTSCAMSDPTSSLPPEMRFTTTSITR